MTDSEHSPPAESRLPTETLLKVYGSAVDEYRFNVNLGWERTKFFLTLNSGLIVAGVGLIRLAEGSWPTHLFLCFYFAFCILLASSGLRTLTQAKRYYREAVFTKTVVERELGLLDNLDGLPQGRGNLSIAVTDGQRDYARILSGEYLRLALSHCPKLCSTNLSE